MVTGGGTGGHLFPGIAIAEAMINHFPQSKVMFVNSGRPLDNKALTGRPFEALTLRCRPLKGKGFVSQLKALFLLPFSLLAALRIIYQFKPDLVFGVGGYVTGPVILAARLLGIPCCIHEQNSIPGLANRILGKIVQRIFTSFPDGKAYFPSRKTIFSGNPVRRELLAASQSTTPKRQDSETLLVLGGSQGAQKVNSLVLSAIALHKSALPSGFGIIHQTGEKDENRIREQYADLGVTARVSAFIQNMAEAYQQADLVVSRAGATTLAELMVFKKPAILIPFPFATDNHQEKNGHYLAENGGAKMFQESDLTGMKLGREIVSLLKNKKMRQQMAKQVGELSKPHATETIIDGCMALLS